MTFEQFQAALERFAGDRFCCTNVKVSRYSTTSGGDRKVEFQVYVDGLGHGEWSSDPNRALASLCAPVVHNAADLGELPQPEPTPEPPSEPPHPPSAHDWNPDDPRYDEWHATHGETEAFGGADFPSEF